MQLQLVAAEGCGGDLPTLPADGHLWKELLLWCMSMNLLRPLQQLLTTTTMSKDLQHRLWRAAFETPAKLVEPNIQHRCQLLVERLPAATPPKYAQETSELEKTSATILAAMQHARDEDVHSIIILLGQYPSSDAVPFALRHYGLDLQFWQLRLLGQPAASYEPYGDQVAWMLLSARSIDHLEQVVTALGMGMEHGLSYWQIGCYLELAVTHGVAVSLVSLPTYIG